MYMEKEEYARNAEEIMQIHYEKGITTKSIETRL